MNLAKYIKFWQKRAEKRGFMYSLPEMILIHKRRWISGIISIILLLTGSIIFIMLGIKFIFIYN